MRSAHMLTSSRDEAHPSHLGGTSGDLPRAPLAALWALMLGTLCWGAWTGFPVFDDAYLVQFLRELGPKAIIPDHPDRPLYGWLMQSLATAFGLARAPYIAVGVAVWALLAWQATRLWARVFPEEASLRFVAALLVLSPTLVETQFTTLTTTIPVNLPVCITLGGLLLCLRPEPIRLGASLLAALLFLLAGALSEYGTATAAASVALLLILGRRRPVPLLLGGAGIGYVILWLTSRGGAVEKTPSLPLLQHLRAVPRHGVMWLTAIADSLVGDWLAVVGSMREAAESRSIWLAAPIAIVSAVLVARLLRSLPRQDGAREDSAAWRRLAALAGAVAAGLLPVMLARRSPLRSAYESRFRTPILPFASVALVALATRLIAPRYRRPVLVLLGSLAAFRAADVAYHTREYQNFLEGVGARLLPMVRGSAGITVAVLPEQGAGIASDLTPKATYRWNEQDAERAWVLAPDEASDLFGPRLSCHGTARIDTPPQFHCTGRKGAVSYLLWIPVRDGSVGDPEPYCIEPPRQQGPP